MDEIDKQDDVIDEIDETNDDVDWKALALKNQGIAKRWETKFKKTQEKPVQADPVKPETKEKPSEPDFKFNSGDKALLKAYNLDIKDPAQMALAENWIKRTGDTIETMMTDDAFNSKLKGMLDAKAAKEAVPTGDKRGAQSDAKDSVEYWVGRKDLPDDLILRRKVVNARIAREKSANSPDVGGTMHNLTGAGFEIR